MLPFTVEQFFDVFDAYNRAIWPAPLVAYGLGVVALVFLFRPGRLADRAAGIILGLMWLWTGIVYHWLHFATINGIARVFGAGFVLQGLLFVYAAVTDRLGFERGSDLRSVIGLALIFYAAVLYPLIGLWFGHRYPAAPMFGTTPCPVTLFTVGCLLLTTKRVPWWLLAFPLLWSIIGGSGAYLLNMPQDWMLLVSAILSILLLADWRRRSEAF